MKKKSIRVQAHKDEVNALYYDAMELLDGNRKEAEVAEKILMKALAIDQRNTQTHIGFVHVYGRLKNRKKAEEYIQKVYDETVRMFPKWPKRMEWGDLDNRAYMRAMQYRADLFADKGEREKAIALYRLLLRLNPNDNQGVRYTLSGIYAGLTGKKVNEMFDEGNRKQDWNKLENLVRQQNAEHKFWKEPKEE